MPGADLARGTSQWCEVALTGTLLSLWSFPGTSQWFWVEAGSGSESRQEVTMSDRAASLRIGLSLLYKEARGQSHCPLEMLLGCPSPQLPVARHLNVSSLSGSPGYLRIGYSHPAPPGGAIRLLSSAVVSLVQPDSSGKYNLNSVSLLVHSFGCSKGYSISPSSPVYLVHFGISQVLCVPSSSEILIMHFLLL